MRNACALCAVLMMGIAPVWWGAVSCAPAAPQPAYDDYRAVLMGFVDERGLVDYASLRHQRGYIDDFVVYVGRLDPKTYQAWSEANQMAFWINAYNALTLHVIIDHYPITPATPNHSYPINSIRQIPNVFDRLRVTVMGQSITLGYIENQHLRRGFKEPRIHMALVCAALSCPKLRIEPYEGAKLDAQLDDQARAFLADPRHFRIDRERNRVRVSEIFRWYADDFAAAKTGKRDAATVERVALVDFVSRYVSDADRASLAGPAYKIEYAPYDWTLNEQPQ
jgi:hypothetical protein